MVDHEVSGRDDAGGNVRGRSNNGGFASINFGSFCIDGVSIRRGVNEDGMQTISTETQDRFCNPASKYSTGDREVKHTDSSHCTR